MNNYVIESENIPAFIVAEVVDNPCHFLRPVVEGNVTDLKSVILLYSYESYPTSKIKILKNRKIVVFHGSS